jgi:anti-sigma B factor antagonist
MRRSPHIVSGDGVARITTFSIRRFSGTSIIDVSGRLTMGAPCDGLHHAIASALKDGAGIVILNLARVDYIDSAGIGELVNGIRAAAGHRSFLKLMKVSRRVHDILKSTAVLSLFECLKDEPRPDGAAD